MAIARMSHASQVLRPVLKILACSALADGSDASVLTAVLRTRWIDGTGRCLIGMETIKAPPTFARRNAPVDRLNRSAAPCPAAHGAEFNIVRWAGRRPTARGRPARLVLLAPDQWGNQCAGGVEPTALHRGVDRGTAAPCCSAPPQGKGSCNAAPQVRTFSHCCRAWGTRARAIPPRTGSRAKPSLWSI